MKILVTGYGEFKDITTNPSSKVLSILRKRSNLVTKTLPVDYKYVQHFYEKLNPIFDLVIHLGVAANSSKIRLEKFAFNQCIGADINNYTPDRITDDPIEHKIQCKLNLKQLFLDLDRNDIVEISEDPGRYLCNYIYYFGLTKRNDCLFIHVPPEDKIPLNQMASVIDRIIGLISENKAGKNCCCFI